MRSDFGALLRRYRRKAGRTMLDLAKHLGVSVVFVSDVERGTRAPFTRERIVQTAEFLKIDPEPLLLAAAKQRGAFELDATSVSGKAREVGAALMRGWADLTEDDLEKIARVVKRRSGLEMGIDRQHGFRTRPLSYQKIERFAAVARSALLPGHVSTQAVPGVDLFENLHELEIVDEKIGRTVSVNYAVNYLPAGLEGISTYDAERDEILVTLDPSTYFSLIAGVPRALFCLCHEVGHVCVHSAKLIELSAIPHRVAALNRGEIPAHHPYEDTEWQANAFAGAFLMPAKGIRELEETAKVLTAQRLATQFNVSFDAARIRLDLYNNRRKELIWIGVLPGDV